MHIVSDNAGPVETVVMTPALRQLYDSCTLLQSTVPPLHNVSDIAGPVQTVETVLHIAADRCTVPAHVSDIAAKPRQRPQQLGLARRLICNNSRKTFVGHIKVCLYFASLAHRTIVSTLDQTVLDHGGCCR